MSWRIADHPQGGMMIEHLVTPRFTARWTTGEFPIDQVRDGAFFWTDEGAGVEDTIHLYGLVWEDPAPVREVLQRLMIEAVAIIEGGIMGGALGILNQRQHE